MLPWLTIIVLAISHSFYLLPFLRRLRCSQLPRPIDFAGASAFLYFDLGMAFECAGYRYRSQFFSPFLEASQTEIILATSLMASSPWLIRMGSHLIPVGPAPTKPKLSLRPGWRRVVFYFLLLASCVGCVAIPFSLISSVPRMWESRSLLGEILGPWIIILSLPMYLLAFFVRLEEAGRWKGKWMLAILVVSAVLATIAVGQRTLVLLPFLIVLLFSQTISWRRLTVTAACVAVAAALMLPMFKFSYQAGDDSATELLADTVMNDFYRAPDLARTLGMSSAVGTHSVSYPGSGYVYAALYFVPRTLAPFKGESTAVHFTGAVTQRSPYALDWGFGISAISESLLNFGIVATPFVLITYGIAIGWLTGKSENWSSLQIPLSLASLWIFGYHLASLLLNFGAMALVGVACEWLFTSRDGRKPAVNSVCSNQAPIL